MEALWSPNIKENVVNYNGECVFAKCSPVLAEQNGNTTRQSHRISSPLALLQENQQSPGFGATAEKGALPEARLRLVSTPLHPSIVAKTIANKIGSGGSWEDIRKLDEDEVWVERTQVVTVEDHILYCEIAKEVVENIITNIPILNMEDTTTAESNSEPSNHQPAEPEEENHLANGSVSLHEEKESLTKDSPKITLDDFHSHDQTLEKSILEDNAFINSCSDLDETVKEILEDEEPISPKKFDDVFNDGDVLDIDEEDKTICEADVDIKLPEPENKEPEISDTIAAVDGGASQDTTDTVVVTDEDTLVTDEDTDEDLVEPVPVTDEDFGLKIDEDSFRPANQAFELELDYLENLSKSEDADHVSDLARQSLYVKFDPLVQAGTTTTQPSQSLSSLAQINPSDLLFPGPIAGADLLCMDTPPKKQTQSRLAFITNRAPSSEEQKLGTEISGPVDHLFEMSPEKHNGSCVDDSKPNESDSAVKNDENDTRSDSSLVQPLLYSKSDLDKAVEKAVNDERDKLTFQWREESAIYALEIKEQTTKVEKLTLERDKALAEIQETKAVMSEYEQTMAQMIEDREKSKCDTEKSITDIVHERDQLQHDLHNTEKSFAHLHKRFEKLKTVVDAYRKNEEMLKKAVKDLQGSNKTAESNYQGLKKHAEEKLQDANNQLSKLQEASKNEITVLQATLKRERSKISSLQQSLEQKKNENKELTAICDELISKVHVHK